MKDMTTRLMGKLCHIKQPKDIDKFLIVVPNFISEFEEEAIAQFVQPKLQRKRYEGNHWDSVITKYKETEMSSLNAPEAVSRTLDRVSNFIRKATDSPGMVILPPHILDLSADGFIDPHVDSVKFSGGIVSGLSLLSTRVMSLAPDHDCDNFKNASTCDHVDNPRTPYYCLKNLDPMADHQTLYKHEVFKDTDECFEGSIELLLPRRSLYILSGPLRYTFTHRIFGIARAPKLINEEILHERRLSIIFRDELQPPIL